MHASKTLLRTAILTAALSSTTLLNTPAHANLTPHTNQHTTHHQTAWEHWSPTGLDPQHAPYPVVFINDPDQTLSNITPDQISDAIQASIATWNNVACAIPQLEFAGMRPSRDNLSEHEIPIFIPDSAYWHDQKSLIAITNMNTPAIALNAIHYTWSLEPAPFQYFPQPSPNQDQEKLIVDLQSVLTHELGHILGLWHTEDDATATMNAKYQPDASQRTLAADDKFALCHLYPSPENKTECTHNHDCPHGPCITDNTFHVCQKSQANPGEFCAVDLLHCPHGCIIESPATGTGYCTAPCQNNADCPTHFQCKTVENQDLCLIIRPDTIPPPIKTTNCSIIAPKTTTNPIPNTLFTVLALTLFARTIRRQKA